ncbi:branched-chain amino acid transport system permease protein [Rhodobium orientis]|uniref:Branched-chain amino acid ABC transporter permease n=1 Tax=Rhodobium orientis TaxID=34017 RepID=A0A327JDE3_9HYPH|nr:branched-chain amino acid ABC transporter permease [Rhodobium orientis]MBB4305702.1 branched-chain amino acid transport system permease protein [Rhodobium orientis]MBK5947883.1 hypothetical protein [Rhodobium orientis]RAI24310.1 hypothetical protein CH339_22390 [Rhodobium orientis]
MYYPSKLRSAVAALLFVAGIVAAFQAGYFGKEILVEIALYALLALSLDFLAGFGGMVSLGHAAFYGIGGYAYVIMTMEAGVPPLAAMALALVPCFAAGWLLGIVTSKVRGIFYIMATLAFGQMIYVFTFQNRMLGGSDGVAGVPRIDLTAIGIDMNDPSIFACAVVVATGLVYLVFSRILTSSFGRTLVGLHRNENRMRALGLSVRWYKAMASGLAGTAAGFAGTIAAQHTMFVSPGMMDWTTSGEVLIMVILGGLETLIGPVVGAAFVVLLKHEISEFTNHWHFFIGVFLIVAILAGGRGLYGSLEAGVARLTRRKSEREQEPGKTTAQKNPEAGNA